MNQIDEINLLKLVNDIKKSKRIFVYGHGHARTLCTYIQNELSAKQKETIICDVDFEKNIIFKMVIFFYSLVSMEIRFTLIKEWCIIF